MKKKILGIGIVTILIIMLVTLTECKNNEKVETNNENNKQEEVVDENIIGTWILNRNVKVSENKYNSLRSLIGDSYGSDTLEINEDGTFSLLAGMLYNLKGKYKYQNSELSFYDIEDINIKNETTLKSIEENLKLQYIEYNGNKFLKMYLYDFTDCEGYLFYEKQPKEKAGSYADDQVPEVQFKKTNNQDSNPKTNEIDNIKREYIGTYENNKKEIIEIELDNNGILYLKSNDKKCQITINESNSAGVKTIFNVSQVLENVTTIYLYPKGVSFSLSNNPANYEEGETDSSKHRLFIKTNREADKSSVYYKR